MRTLLTSALCAALLSCGPGVVWAAPAPDAADMSKPATEYTRAAHAAMSKEVDFADRQDFQDAQRGFLAPLPDRGRILDANGRETWNLAPYDFLAPAMSRDFPPSVIMPTQAPDTVNPSLWRQSQLVLRDGLYKVVDRLYQIRNADLSNMTIIEGDSGIIVVDPLISAENAAAALKLYYAHRPHKPVVAVIYSHSHVDHYGGVHGVVDEKDVAAGKVRIIAPKGFMEAAVAENVLAGNAMSRRAQYMYGSLLPPSPRGHVGAGLGRHLPRHVGPAGAHPPHRKGWRDPAAGRPYLHLPDGAQHRGPGGDALVHPGTQGPDRRRELHPHHAQPLHPARGQGARSPVLEPCSGREPAALGRRGGGPVRHAPLARLGSGTGAYRAGPDAGPVPLHQ